MKKKYFLASFLIPALITMLALSANHIFPFGDNTLIMSDAGAYYQDYISFWHRILTAQSSLLYSFSKGIGGSMVAQNAWNLLSPYFLLFVFANKNTLPLWYTIVCILMTSTCGLTMYILLRNLFGDKGSNLIFSTSYALIGFMVVNNWQLQWLDGVIVLPLIFLGLWKIAHGKSFLLYVISLAYALYTNFYIGYELCIASITFYVFLVITIPKENVLKDTEEIHNRHGRQMNRSVRFICGTLLSGLMTSFVWLPTLITLADGRAKQVTSADFKYEETHSLLSVFARFFSGAHSQTELINGLPAIFCGILTLALVILFFMNKKISKREKAASVVVIVIFLVSFQITTFSSVFQMFSKTNWFNYRYSFAFSFFLILMAAKEFEFLDEVTVRQSVIANGILVAFSIVVFCTEYEFVNGSSAILDLALLVLMWVGFYLYKTKPAITPRKVLVEFLLLVVCINLYANYALSMNSIKKWFNKNYNYQDGTNALADVIDYPKCRDSSFYRMETEIVRTSSIFNEPLFFGYDGVGYGGSCERKFVTKNMGRLGVTWYDMRNYYLIGMPASMDSFLGLKYIISKRDLTAEKGYKKLYDGTFGLQVFENPYVLPISMLSTDQIRKVHIADEPDVFKIQNQIWQSLTGNKQNLYDEENDFKVTLHDPTKADMTVTSSEARSDSSQKQSADDLLQMDKMLVEQPGNPKITEDSLYLEYSFTAKQDGPVYIYNYGDVDPNSGTDQTTLQYVGTFKKGDAVTGKIPYTLDKMYPSVLKAAVRNIYIAYANMDALKNDAAAIQNQGTKIRKVSGQDDHLSGTFKATTGQKLFFTIPYDEGWSLYIDGQKAPLTKTIDLFMSADVPKGEHSYKLVFFPVGMKAGIIISCSALAAFIVWLCLEDRTKKKLQ